jgi:hypothetical protein
MNALELRSAVICLDEEMAPHSEAAVPSSPAEREALDNSLVRANTSLFMWVFR